MILYTDLKKIEEMKYLILFLLFLILIGCSKQDERGVYLLEHKKSLNNIVYVGCPLNIKAEGYRLFIGPEEYEWIDIYSIRDEKFNITYEDTSKIEKVICMNDNSIQVHKFDSIWVVKNINNESDMSLTLYSRR